MLMWRRGRVIVKRRVKMGQWEVRGISEQGGCIDGGRDGAKLKMDHVDVARRDERGHPFLDLSGRSGTNNE